MHFPFCVVHSGSRCLFKIKVTAGICNRLKENRVGKVFHTRAPLRPGLIRKLCPSSPSARPSNQLSVLSLH